MERDTVQSVETYLVTSGVTKNWLFVQLRTGQGLIGWGECYTAPDREPAIRALVESLSEHLIGKSIYEIRRFTLAAYNDIATMRGSMELFCAVSGLEHALWDVVGKTVGQPIYNLLGGPLRTKLRVYANGWAGPIAGTKADIESVTAAAEDVVAQGFTAMKLDPFPGTWGWEVTRDDIDFGIDLISELRSALGASVDILVEGHRRFSPMVAQRIAKLLEPLDPFWFEEPVSSTNIEALAEVRRDTSIPIVTGEELYTLNGFRDAIKHRAVDIINPDVGNTGGILELVSISNLAHVNMVAVAPHNYNSMSVGLAATLQASAVMPSFLITEYFVNFAERSAAISKTPKIEVVDGHVTLGQAPGHGVDLDEDALRYWSGKPVPRTFHVNNAYSSSHGPSVRQSPSDPEVTHA